MMHSNLQEPEQALKRIHDGCQVKFPPQNSHDCQDCRYRHKGICNVSIECNTGNYNNVTLKNLEEKMEILTISSFEDSEPVINLENLFYKIEINNNAKKSAEFFPQKAKYDNFKLLVDINAVLQKCTHLTNKERLMYCTSQRYFMKLYLREINKPE